jgi:hypothetical protein
LIWQIENRKENFEGTVRQAGTLVYINWAPMNWIPEPQLSPAPHFLIKARHQWYVIVKSAAPLSNDYNIVLFLPQYHFQSKYFQLFYDIFLPTDPRHQTFQRLDDTRESIVLCFCF